MKINFIYRRTLPDVYVPGEIYFVEDEGAIYVATSATNVVKYSAYKTLEEKQDLIEDLDTIRTGASIARNITTISTTDIDGILESNN